MDAPSSPPDDVNRLPLRALGLKPGMSLQTRRLVAGAQKREAQYFGGIEGKGIMVGPLGAGAEPTELQVGDICLVRGFTGQYEYSFPSKVLQTFVQPFVYALLAYPAQVDAKLVRKSLRVKRSCPAALSQVRADGSLETVDALLVDVSNAGALVKSTHSPAAVGSSLQVSLAIPFEGETLTLSLDARVCHSSRSTYEEAYFIGLAFTAPSNADKLKLAYLTQGP